MVKVVGVWDSQVFVRLSPRPAACTHQGMKAVGWTNDCKQSSMQEYLADLYIGRVQEHSSNLLRGDGAPINGSGLVNGSLVQISHES